MNKIKVFQYELVGIIGTKKYKYMVGLLLIYAYYVFIRFIVPAPFGLSPLSKWSYSYFITLFNPLVWVILILLCTAVFSEKEERVKKILFSTPLLERNYFLLKAGSILTAIGISLLCTEGLIDLLYGYYFHSWDVSISLLPFCVFSLPSILFIVGISIFLGKWNRVLLYILLPISFLYGMLDLDVPVWLDVNGDDYLADYLFQYSYANRDLSLSYVLPDSVLYSRLLFVGLGIFFFILACRKTKM